MHTVHRTLSAPRQLLRTQKVNRAPQVHTGPLLQVCEHPHLLPLFGYCLDAASPCLVFPLMVGGSLQTRLWLTPRDVDHLKKMGHFDAAPKPLTWRQKLKAVLQATEALVYLHTPDERKPRTLHRDFKALVCLA